MAQSTVTGRANTAHAAALLGGVGLRSRYDAETNTTSVRTVDASNVTDAQLDQALANADPSWNPPLTAAQIADAEQAADATAATDALRLARAKARQVAAGADTFTPAELQRIAARLLLRAIR
jgi:hypothetical protein